MRAPSRLLTGLWPAPEIFAPDADKVARAHFIARAFYAALLFFACERFLAALELARTQTMDPLWPLFWIRWTGQPAGALAAQLLFLFGGLAAAWRPDCRTARVAAFLGCLAGMAFDNSFGKVNHHLHLWTMTAFLFVFLPSWKGTRRSPALQEATLRLFWGAQAAVFLTYSMSGIAKLLGTAVQIARGDAHTLFSSDALARHVAERLLQTGERSVLGDAIIAHPAWGTPAFLGAVYLETFALAAAFRPSLHRPWGLGLVLLHVGIFLTMNVAFPHSILLLCLLFLASPFSRRSFRARGTLGDLPVFGPFLAALIAWIFPAKDGRTVVFYDGDCGLCSRWIAFLLARPLARDIHFASQQGPLYAALKARHPALEGVDSVVAVREEDGEETVRVRAEAMFWLMPQRAGWTRALVLVNLVPMFALNAGYRVVSGLRHRAGRATACATFSAAERARFLEAP
jgi:predicted DCC family thiol-disulfide oxidoreductase YuxK